MKKEIKKYLLTAVCIILAMVLYSFAVIHGRQLKKYERYVAVCLTDYPLAAEQAEIVGKDMAVVGRGESTFVQNERLGRYAQANVRYVAGEMSILLPDIAGVDLTETSNDCVISSDVAKELFGTTKVVGMTFSCNEQDYIIRDVTDYQIETENEIILSPKANPNAQYDKVMLRKEDNASTNMLEWDLTSRYGISGKIVDTQFVFMVNQLITVLFLLIVGITFTIRLHKCGKQSSKWSDELIIWTCYVIVWGMVIYMMSRQIHFPLEECPAQWSDFEAWGIVAKAKMETWRLYGKMKGSGIYSIISKVSIKMWFETVGAIVCYFVGIKCLRKEEEL